MADVFVMVKVKVFVCELNSQTTVAVDAWPELTPEMVIVSARAVALANTNSAANENTNLPNRDICEDPPCAVPQNIHPPAAFTVGL